MKPWKAEFYLFLVTFIWGGTFLFTKIGIEYCPPSLYIILRFAVALVLSLAIFGKHLKKINKKLLIQGVLLGLFFGGGFLLQTWGLKLTSVSKSAFITGLAVPLVPFAYWLVAKKKVLLWPKIGVIIATMGLWVFTNPTFDNLNVGDILTFISTLFWAFYITYMDIFTSDYSEISDTAILVILQIVTAFPLALIVFFIVEYQNFYFEYSPNLLISLAFNGILASFLVTYIHTSIQKYTTPVKAALIFSLEPIIASIVAMFALHEIFYLRQYLGGSLLLFGVLISETGEYILSHLRKRKS